MAVRGSVPNPGTIVSHLVVRNVQEAVEFYTGAFSAKVLYRSSSPSGEGEHAHLRVWSSLMRNLPRGEIPQILQSASFERGLA
jgi:hypothetical protein